jgi:sugar lactone lactonase YvrE
MKRNIYIQEQKSKGTSYRQIEKKSFGFDTVSLIKVQNGLDQYNARKNVEITTISGSFRFEGTFNIFELDLEALKQIVAAKFGVSVDQLTLNVRPGSVILEYTITATVSKADTIIPMVSYGSALTNFALSLRNSINSYNITGLTLTPGGAISGTSANQSYTSGNYNVIPFLGSGQQNTTQSAINGYRKNAKLMYPSSISVDNQNGDVYISDNSSFILKVPSSGISSTFTTSYLTTNPQNSIQIMTVDGVNGYLYAGGKDYLGRISRYKLSDGTYDSSYNLTQPSYESCAGLVLNSAGNFLYVSDIISSTIVVIDVVNLTSRIIAGISGTIGYADGPSTNEFRTATTQKLAVFNAPTGLALDTENDILYIADTNNFVIRALNLNTGMVSTVAGTPGVSGWVDGSAPKAQFNGPTNLAYNSNYPGNLFVCDSGNNLIRQIAIRTDFSNVTTLAGDGNSGFISGSVKNAQFRNPRGITLSDTGILYISDTENYQIRKIYFGYTPPSNPTRYSVTTIAGFPGKAGFLDGPGNQAVFDSPSGICYDGFSSLYITDAYNNCIRKIDLNNNIVDLIAGDPKTRSTDYTYRDGIGLKSTFNNPFGLCFNGSNSLIISDSWYYSIRTLNLTTNTVSTNSGGLPIAVGGADGLIDVATLNIPIGICYDRSNFVYIADSGNSSIRKLDIRTNFLSTLTGNRLMAGYTDGRLDQALFKRLSGICYDGTNCLYVTDTYNYSIRKIDLANNNVSTLAGNPSIKGHRDGPGNQALFTEPYGICYDGSKYLYITDYGNTIRRIDSTTGDVTTIAGISEIQGYQNGPGDEALFKGAMGICYAGTCLYVAESFNNCVRKILL